MTLKVRFQNTRGVNCTLIITDDISDSRSLSYNKYWGLETLVESMSQYSPKNHLRFMITDVLHYTFYGEPE